MGGGSIEHMRERRTAFLLAVRRLGVPFGVPLERLDSGRLGIEMLFGMNVIRLGGY